jgi:hypothetical protein
MLGGSLSTALVRTLCQVLQKMWLSAAIGAAATWATVNAQVVTTLRQLQVWYGAAAAAAHSLSIAVCVCSVRAHGVHAALSIQRKLVQ